jgi:replicative DNA helicase
VELRTDQRPKLSDLRESGALEQDADVVLFIHRPQFEEGARPESFTMSLLIEKHRNGPTGEVTLHFESKHASYSDVDDHYASLPEVSYAAASGS